MSRSQKTTYQPVTDWNHTMSFGKFKGYSVGDVADADPNYLLWLCQNTTFDLDHKLLDEVEEKAAKWRP